MALYKELNSKFMILDYSATHNQLLMRSVQIAVCDTTNKKIDINKVNDLKKKIKFYLNDKEGNDYFINASSVLIFENQQSSHYKTGLDNGGKYIRDFGELIYKYDG